MSKDILINDYFLKKISHYNISFDSNEFSILVKKCKQLSLLGVDSEQKASRYKLLRDAARKMGINPSKEFYKKAINSKIYNSNDALFTIMEDQIRAKGIKKVAYPNSFGGGQPVEGEVDLNKWLNTVHMIYDSVQKGEMTKHNALEYYSNFLDIDGEEKFRFKKWFKYYSEGEHLKYSSRKEQEMKKKAVYMSNLGQSAGVYSHSPGGFNLPGDSFDGETFDSVTVRSKDKTEKESEFNSWKGKLHGALRRIDKLLRSQHMDGEKYKLLAEHLLNLSHQVHCLKLASTISDVTYKTAGALEKHGQKDVADILVKIAQEAPAQPIPQADEAPAQPIPQADEAPAQPAPQMGEAPAAEEKDPNDPKNAIPSGDDVEPASLRDITPIPGARQGEYEELAGNVTLDDAAQKLDEVAGMLADRRIIRQLAEFDIMLDKIGIASMFPELAESQSKLIDSFSYALTRVTKMMGQLANAKSIIDSKNNLPGRDEPSPSEAQPEEDLGTDI